MGPYLEKKIKRLIYPTLTFSALTTRLKENYHKPQSIDYLKSKPSSCQILSIILMI